MSEPEPELERRDDDRHAIKGDGLMLQFGSSLTAREQKSIAWRAGLRSCAQSALMRTPC